jgi:hypothetical protein
VGRAFLIAWAIFVEWVLGVRAPRGGWYVRDGSSVDVKAKLESEASFSGYLRERWILGMDEEERSFWEG